jgi:cytochrome b6-f complex iron-sulfur subunit
MKRRDLIKKALLGGTTFVLMPTAFNGCSKDKENNVEEGIIFTIDLKDPTYAALKNEGGSFVYNNEIIVVNSGTWGFWAYDSKCTHAGCAVQLIWPPIGTTIFRCQCHSSTFDDYGKVVGGPATKDLTEYHVIKSGDILSIRNKT